MPASSTLSRRPSGGRESFRPLREGVARSPTHSRAYQMPRSLRIAGERRSIATSSTSLDRMGPPPRPSSPPVGHQIILIMRRRYRNPDHLPPTGTCEAPRHGAPIVISTRRPFERVPALDPPPKPVGAGREVVVGCAEVPIVVGGVACFPPPLEQPAVRSAAPMRRAPNARPFAGIT
jgi:hypothetical protein